jgi:hypothetical protein
MRASKTPEDRQARRFPLKLPVAVTGKTTLDRTRTENISSGGVVFCLDSQVEVGANVALSIRLPAEVLGAPQDVLVNCSGRVVRSSPAGHGNSVAVVIDEYEFERC